MMMTTAKSKAETYRVDALLPVVARVAETVEYLRHVLIEVACRIDLIINISNNNNNNNNKSNVLVLYLVLEERWLNGKTRLT